MEGTSVQCRTRRIGLFCNVRCATLRRIRLETSRKAMKPIQIHGSGHMKGKLKSHQDNGTWQRGGTVLWCGKVALRGWHVGAWILEDCDIT